MLQFVMCVGRIGGTSTFKGREFKSRACSEFSFSKKYIIALTRTQNGKRTLHQKTNQNSCNHGLKTSHVLQNVGMCPIFCLDVPQTAVLRPLHLEIYFAWGRVASQFVFYQSIFLHRKVSSATLIHPSQGSHTRAA